MASLALLSPNTASEFSFTCFGTLAVGLAGGTGGLATSPSFLSRREISDFRDLTSLRSSESCCNISSLTQSVSDESAVAAVLWAINNRHSSAEIWLVENVLINRFILSLVNIS